MGVQHYEEAVSISSTDRLTALHYSYGCATLGAAYLCYLHVQNHWVTLDIRVSNGKCRLCWLVEPSKSLNYTLLMGIQP